MLLDNDEQRYLGQGRLIGVHFLYVTECTTWQTECEMECIFLGQEFMCVPFLIL